MPGKLSNRDLWGLANVTRESHLPIWESLPRCSGAGPTSTVVRLGPVVRQLSSMSNALSRTTSRSAYNALRFSLRCCYWEIAVAQRQCQRAARFHFPGRFPTGIAASPSMGGPNWIRLRQFTLQAGGKRHLSSRLRARCQNIDSSLCVK